MHELSILVEVIRVVEEMAEQQNLDSIKTIVLQIGELSPVVPRFLVDYMPYVVENKPKFKDTELKIEILPGTAMCQNCKTAFNVIETKGYCPKCGSFDKDLLCGQEFLIKEIEVPNG